MLENLGSKDGGDNETDADQDVEMVSESDQTCGFQIGCGNRTSKRSDRRGDLLAE